MKKERATSEKKTKSRSLDVLGLSGVIPITAEINEWFDGNSKIHEMVIQANLECNDPPVCTCGSNHKPRRHDTRQITVRDIPQGRSWTRIILRRPRFKCPHCGRFHIATSSVIHEKYRMTRRLVSEVEILGLRHPFAQVSKMTGVDEKTIRSIVNEFIDILEERIPLLAPVVVGIDEVHAGVLQAADLVITDIENGELLELSDDGLSLEAVENKLAQLVGHKNIQFGVSDMAGHYHTAMTNTFSEISTIVDKRHVQIKAREALATVREQTRRRTKKNSAELYGDRGILNKRRHQLTKEERGKVSKWSKTYPRLGKAYELKEGYFDLFDHGDYEKAWAAFETWSASIPEDLEVEFRKVRNSFVRHKDKIRAYFDSGKRYTNAVTEAINGLIKEIKRGGRGYSHKVLRAKALHKHGRWHERAIYKHIGKDIPLRLGHPE